MTEPEIIQQEPNRLQRIVLGVVLLLIIVGITALTYLSHAQHEIGAISQQKQATFAQVKEQAAIAEIKSLDGRVAWGAVGDLHEHFNANEETADWVSEDDFRIAGTPGYMSPERTRGGSITPAGDVFSTGAVLYEMLSGQKAFGGSHMF